MISMNDIRLAQLFKVKSVDVSKLQKIDVAYCVKGDPSMRIASSYAGYNCLHFEAGKGNLTSIKVLVDKGADLLQQSLEDGLTPLHVAYYSAFPEPFNMSSADKANQKLVINTLLSMLVEKNLGENPKCKEGLSHCHIACIVNHVAALHLFLKNGVCLNDKINSDSHIFPGFTALHFAIEYSSVEAAEVLLKNGADIHAKDSDGVSPLQLLIELLLNLKDSKHIGKRKICSSSDNAIQDLEIIAELILKAKGSSELESNDENILFCLASCLDTSRVSELLGSSNLKAHLIEPRKWKKWTPLHFAACSSIKNFEILVQSGADSTLQNSDGDTPLDFLLMRYDLEVIHSVLSKDNNVKNVLLSDGVTTVLDLLITMNNCSTLSNFLGNLKEDVTVSQNSPVWAGYNVLHLAVKIPEKRKRTTLCLKSCCSVTTKSKDGLTPIHLALNLHKADIVDLLLDKCYNNVSNSDNIDVLHIACATDRLDVIDRIITLGTNINSQTSCSFQFPSESRSELLFVRAKSTPLHIAVIFGHKNLVRFLLKKGADVYAKDALGCTPIHLSMDHKSSSVARNLLKEISNVEESVSNDGLSHLHVAAFANSKTHVKKLIQDGSNINQVLNVEVQNQQSWKLSFLARYAGMTPLLVALEQSSGDAVRELLRNGAQIFHEGQSVLAMVMSKDTFLQLFSEHLKHEDLAAQTVDSSGVTLLHLACITFDFKWAEDLLQKGAEVNAQMYTNYGKGQTPLHILINEALNYIAPSNWMDIVHLLLENGADVTIKNGHRSPIIMAASKSSFFHMDTEKLDTRRSIVADLLLKNQKSYASNPVDKNGFSHFHYACLRNECEIVKKFLENGIDVNQSTDPFSGGFTPLHIALRYRSLSVARLLIQEGADVNAENQFGQIPLHVALANLKDLELFELMFSKASDINAESPFSGRKPIDSLIFGNIITEELFELCLNKGCTLEIADNGSSTVTIGFIMERSEPTCREAIMARVIESCNLRRPVKNGFNPIRSLVAVTNIHELDLSFYVDNIQVFMEMGYEIDQQGEDGKTALHDAVKRFDSEAIEALLLLGARMDIADNKGEFPLEGSCLEFFELETIPEEWLEVISKYIWKMKRAGMIMHESLEKTLKAILFYELPTFDIAADIDYECVLEIKELEETKIGESLNMNDFLRLSMELTEYPMMSFAQRSNLQEFFEDSKHLHIRFPMYSGILLMQYRKALQRKKLHQSAKPALTAALEILLPDLCLENIFKYFNNKELIMLINDYSTQF